MKLFILPSCWRSHTPFCWAKQRLAILILFPVPPGQPETQQTYCSLFLLEHLEMPHATSDSTVLGWCIVPSYATQFLLEKLPNDQAKWLHTKQLHICISLLKQYKTPHHLNKIKYRNFDLTQSHNLFKAMINTSQHSLLSNHLHLGFVVKAGTALNLHPLLQTTVRPDCPLLSLCRADPQLTYLFWVHILKLICLARQQQRQVTQVFAKHYITQLRASWTWLTLLLEDLSLLTPPFASGNISHCKAKLPFLCKTASWVNAKKKKSQNTSLFFMHNFLSSNILHKTWKCVAFSAVW